jgi:uncharacterized Zn finger protein
MVTVTARILTIAIDVNVVRSIEPFWTLHLEQVSQVRVQEKTEYVPEEKRRVECDRAGEFTATVIHGFDQKVFAQGTIRHPNGSSGGRNAKGKSFPV